MGGSGSIQGKFFAVAVSIEKAVWWVKDRRVAVVFMLAASYLLAKMLMTILLAAIIMFSLIARCSVNRSSAHYRRAISAFGVD